MTQEERQLLIKDLCARLLYGVICCVTHKKDGSLVKEDMKLSGIFEDGNLYFLNKMGSTYSDNYIPYLRSTFSMTEEELKELKKEHENDERLYAECINRAKNGDSTMRGKVIPHFAADWCDSHHINYRLPDNLFIEAPEGMYNTKK